MSQVKVETMKVKSLSKFGFFVEGKEKGVYFSKKLDASSKTNIVPGVEFEGELFVSDTGGEYLNKVVKFLPGVIAKATVVESKKEAVVTPKKESTYKTKEDTTMSKSDWALKDRSQLIGGLSHDAAAITAALVAVDTNLVPLDVYKELLEGMLKIRSGVK